MQKNTKTEKVTTKTEEVETTNAPKIESASAIDYSKYASMAETPVTTERRQFDFIAVSGAVETESVKGEGGEDLEKRKPASAYKLFLTKPKIASEDRFETETLALPLTLIPIKYRVVMEQRAGSKGEILVLKSSEFNGKMSDMVIISRFSPDGKVIEKYGPMTVAEARQTFKNAEGKGVLRDKAHVYALHNNEVVRFVVKGAGLWEDKTGLINGKTEASRAVYPFLTDYFSQFPINEPYFLFEMKVNAVYRDHVTVKFYRPIFERGARISPEVEVEVLKHLEDLHGYFSDMDAEVAKFVATSPSTNTVVVDEESEDKPF